MASRINGDESLTLDYRLIIGESVHERTFKKWYVQYFRVGMNQPFRREFPSKRTATKIYSHYEALLAGGRFNIFEFSNGEI